MPSLYSTNTNYTVSSTQTNSLYAYATSGTIITGTVQTSYMPGLYQGTAVPQPTNAQALLTLFDNSGDVKFFVDPATNNTTIYAVTTGSQTTASITALAREAISAGQNIVYSPVTGVISGTNTLGSYSVNNNVITNTANTAIDFVTNTYQWKLNPDGTTAFPNYVFPTNKGQTGQALFDNGTGQLFWNTVSNYTTATVDLFAGDTITTVFTLTNTPISQAFCTVDISGVTQTPGVSWRLQNLNNIVFANPPPAAQVGQTSTNISVTYYSIATASLIPGAQGTTGAQGVQGASIQGTQGSIGPSGGVQGATGAQGSIGTQGTTGVGTTGTQGIQGLQGPGVGSQGVQGVVGPQGTTGLQGPAGSGSGGTGTSGVIQLIAGSGISLSPASGTGTVTITNTGIPGPSGNGIGYYGSSGQINIVGSGTFVTNQGIDSIAIGIGAGNTNQGILPPGSSGSNEYGIAIGPNAGNYYQSVESIAIGQAAGQTSQGYTRQGYTPPGYTTDSNGGSIAIGGAAGQTNQGDLAIAIGYVAGENSQGSGAIAIGAINSVGQGALGNPQGSWAISIGAFAGWQQGTGAIEIGGPYLQPHVSTSTKQIANSVIINASGYEVTATNTSTYLAPVRHITNGSLPSGFYNMAYNPTTKEIIYWS